MKEFLSTRGFAYTDKNVQEDPLALRELMDLGSRATPTTVIGEEVVMGYDIDRISDILEGEGAGTE